MIQQTVAAQAADLNSTLCRLCFSMAKISDLVLEFVFNEYDIPAGLAPSGQISEVDYHRGLSAFTLDKGYSELDLKVAVQENEYLVNAHMHMTLPLGLEQMVQRHLSDDLFASSFTGLGFTLSMKVPVSCDFSEYVTFYEGNVRICCDAMTETKLRQNSGALIRELEPCLEWLEYIAPRSFDIPDLVELDVLINDLRLIFSYSAQGGQLNFAKLSYLCDLTGNLEPVRNLINSKMPNLLT